MRKLADVPADDVRSDSETETDSETTDSDSDSEIERKIEKVCDRKFQVYAQCRQQKRGKKYAKMLSQKMVQNLIIKGDKSDKGEQKNEHLVPETFATCRVCNKEFSCPEAFHLHLRSKTHKHKAMEAYILEQASENGEVDTEPSLIELYNKIKKDAQDDDAKGKIPSFQVKDKVEKIPEDFERKECEKICRGLTPYTQHLTSKAQAKQIERKKILHEMIPEDPSNGNTASDKTKHKDMSTLSLEDGTLACKLCSTSFSGSENAMMHLKSKNHVKKLDKYITKMEKKKEVKGSGSGDKEVGDQPGKKSRRMWRHRKKNVSQPLNYQVQGMQSIILPNQGCQIPQCLLINLKN